jgi:glyoxylase I family protein
VKIEHVAFQVEDPKAVSAWWVKNLGLTIKRTYPDRPWGHFLADDGDAVMVEFYNNPKAAVPDYRAIDPLMLHVAFVVEDVAMVRERLIAGGATPEGDPQTAPNGDILTMLRDPWGLAVQLVRRQQQMI